MNDKITLRFDDGEVVEMHVSDKEAAAWLNGRAIVGGLATPIITPDGALGTSYTTPPASGGMEP